MSDAGLAVAIAGVAASGKTTATTAVCDKLLCQRVSYGDYLRKEAHVRGLEPARVVLQNLGAEMITRGWGHFTNAVLSQATDWTPGASLAIDGVRHLGAISSLRDQVSPSRLMVLYIDIDEATQEQRLRRGGRELDLATIREHHVELELPQLREVADVVVTNSGDIATFVTDVSATLTSLQAQARETE